MYAAKNMFTQPSRRQSSRLKKSVYEHFSHRVEHLLSKANIRINGDNPWDIQVHNNNFYQRVLAEGLGLGASSDMDGWWDCHCLDEFFNRILRAGLDRTVRSWKTIFDHLKARLFNFQKISRACQVGKKHYDIGNDLYGCMLDELMIYSCAYWKNANTLTMPRRQSLIWCAEN